ncbi:Uncharacterised protein [uncultured archaeon]|nr:Uncharacterised protein [uncultured archaeon]
MHLTINIDIKKSHALILSTILFILVIGIAADYASSAGGLTQWHPLTEISADGGTTSIATTDGKKINASYIDGSAGSSQWTTSGSSIYYNAGNVGVGTPGPGEKLDVSGGNIRASGTVYSTGNQIYTTYPGGYGQTALNQWGLSSGGTMYLEPTGGSTLYLTDSWATTGSLRIRFGTTIHENSGGGTVSSVDSNGNAYFAGNVGIGTATPGTKLEVNGDVRTTDLKISGSNQGTNYIRLGDVQVAWGQATAPGSYSQVAISLPSSFLDTSYAVQVTEGDPDGSGYRKGISVKSRTTNSFIVWAPGGSGTTWLFDWLAVGKWR